MVNLKLVSGDALLEFSTDAKIADAQDLLMAITQLWFESLDPDETLITDFTVRIQNKSAALQAAITGASHAEPDA